MDRVRELRYRLVADTILHLFPADPAPGSEWESDILHARRWATAAAVGGTAPELDGETAAEGTMRVAAFLDEYYDGADVQDGTAYAVAVIRDWGHTHRRGGLLAPKA